MIANVPAKLKEEIACLRSHAVEAPKKDDPAKIQSEIDRLNILFQKGRITEEYYDSQYDMLSEKLNQLQNRSDNDNIEKYKKLQRTFSGDWLDIYQSLDNEHKNAFWKSTIKSIEIDPETRKLKGFHFLWKKV